MRVKRSGWETTRLLAAVCLLWGTYSLARGEERPTVHQQLVKARHDWIVAGRPEAKEKATEAPEFGTDSVTAIEVQSYAFQPGTSTDQLLDDGNGYRYFGAAVNPYTAAAVQVPTGVVIDFIKFSGCQVNGGDSFWASTTMSLVATRACRSQRWSRPPLTRHASTPR